MASTSSPPSPFWKHDVFLSFRGTDTRNSFTSHLHAALQRNQINAYIDNKLDGGEKLERALLEKIEDSYISVVIFSEKYADSTFCLRELSKIHECMETKGQKVLPVFHQLDPGQVQDLTGSYGEALSRHERECASEEVESWRHALKEIANLKGWDSRGIKDETKLIEEIVSDIQRKLHHAPSTSIDAKGLVGMQSRVEHIESLLSLGSTGVLIVGIWGIGGIGKSTTAEAVYKRNSHKFESRCFFRYVREETKKHGIDHVRQEILGKVLEKKDLNIRTKVLPPDIKRMLQRKKVLIVLDDVNDSQDLRFLVGEDDLFGQGSRIIVTSRDKQVLINACQENIIYKVNELDEDDALRLFSFHAFKQNNPPHGYTTLSKDVVSCAKGIPLVLEVLGASLYKKSDVYWKSKVEQLRTNGGEDIKKRLPHQRGLAKQKLIRQNPGPDSSLKSQNKGLNTQQEQRRKGIEMAGSNIEPFWNHVKQTNNGRLQCKFCGNLFAKGTSISRIKFHLSGEKGRGVRMCGEVPKQVQEAALLSMPGGGSTLKTMRQRRKTIDASEQEQNNVGVAQQQELPRDTPDESKKLEGSKYRVMVDYFLSGWKLLLINLILEMASAVFDQLGYAFVGMVLAFVALLLSTAELIYMERKSTIAWCWQLWYARQKKDNSILPISHRTSTDTFAADKLNSRDGTIVEYFGLVGAVWQCVYSAVEYAYARQKKDNPIKICLLPFLFLSCVAISKLIKK